MEKEIRCEDCRFYWDRHNDGRGMCMNFEYQRLATRYGGERVPEWCPRLGRIEYDIYPFRRCV